MMVIYNNSDISTANSDTSNSINDSYSDDNSTVIMVMMLMMIGLVFECVVMVLVVVELCS